jgi:hypothetical protein
MTMLLRVGNLMSLSAAALVAWALWQAQRPGMIVETGPLYYPAGYDITTKHGWPAFFVLQKETGDRFTPNSQEFRHTIAPCGLAVDIAAWCAIVMATFCLSWRAFRQRFQCGLGFLFSTTTTVAVLLAWWRVEYQACWDPKYTALLILIAETPMLRLLHFSPLIYIPILLGTSCLILGMILMLGWLVRRVAKLSCPPRAG